MKAYTGSRLAARMRALTFETIRFRTYDEERPLTRTERQTWLSAMCRMRARTLPLLAVRHRKVASTACISKALMCCPLSGKEPPICHFHLSTGTVGVDNRYVIAILSREEIQYDDGVERFPDTSVFDVSDDSSARHARDTVTGFVNMLFPDGRID